MSLQGIKNSYEIKALQLGGCFKNNS